MTLTKKVEAEIRIVYQAYWDSYLTGDLKTMGGFLSDDFILIGTPDGEVFNNKKSAMKYLKATIHQVAGVLSKKNIEVKIAKVDDTILVTEFFDAYVNTDNLPTFYGKFRATSVMKKVRGRWKIIHQHGSLPDSKAEVGETLAIGKVKKENRELRNAVKRRTRELEQKNRELEIEASLERVRARAMAMQSSSELADLIALIQTELTRQDVNLMRSFIVLFDASGDSTWWMAGKGFGSLNRGYHMPGSDHPPQKAYFNGWRKRDSVWRYVLKGTVKKRWDNFIFKDTELAELPRTLVSGMRKVKTTFLAASFNKYGCISTGDPIPPTPSAVDLLVRFSRIFEQTYTRFLDLQKAERQTREAQIELSLERVRAKAMAMQSSSELADLIGMIHSEISRLDKNLDRSYIMLFEKSGGSTWWMSDDKNLSLKRGYKLPYHKHPPYLACLLGWRRRKVQWTYLLKGAVKKKWDEFIFKETELAQLPKMIKSHMAGAKVAYWSSSFNKYGCISTGSFKPLERSSFELMVRFSQMFEQTYTRFLDLQKAEAQARESQIQLALERVRARTMAMQHSDELQEAANLLFKQVQSLEIPAWSCGYNIWEKHEKVCTGWMSTNDAIQPPFKIPLTESPTFIRFYKSRKKNEDFYVEEVEGDALVAHYKYMLSLPDFAKIVEEGFSFPQSQINHVVNFAHGNLIFITGESVPDAWDIFKRFAKVFEQTYTRFLDLKKAEAQALEARIEAALERVRSRTMAMHRTDELREVVSVLYEQLRQLGFRYGGGANIALMDPDNGDIEWWMSGFGLDEFPDSYLVKYFNHPALNEILKCWKKGEKFASIRLTGESKKEFDRSLLFESDFRRIPEEAKLEMANLETVVFSLAYMKYGALNIGAEAITREQAEILQRFAIVFEQTYTRFLDLKKAEAQAREAQIEAALEKIRSRSLAMHRSDEVRDVVLILFKKLAELKVVHDTVAIQLFDFKTKDSIFWPGNDLSAVPQKISLPFDEKMMEANTCHRDLWQAMADGEVILNKVYSKEQKDFWFQYVFAHNDIEEHAREFITQANTHTVCFIPGKTSALFADSFDGSCYTEQEMDVLKRAARVFEQAYIRFLDLQKAEAQAKEAQIEAALEKVRSSSMAMHHSHELETVVGVLFDKLSELGLSFDAALLFVFDKPKRNIQSWIATKNLPTPINIILSYDEEMTKNTIVEDLRRGDDIINKSYSGKTKDDYFRYTVRHNESKIPENIRKLFFELSAWTVSFAVEKNSIIAVDSWFGQTMSIENFQILKRFARVFEQAYVRFLDLQNAEAQAREAQIEAALEKVRSSSMAMHHSDELEKVVTVLFDKLSELGLSFDGALIYTFDKGKRNLQLWVASKLLSAPVKVELPYNDEIAKNPIIEDLWRAIENGEHVLNKSYSGKIKDDYFLYVENNNENDIAQAVRDLQMRSESYTISFAAEKNSVVGFDSWTGQTTTDQDFQVLRRFAGVFEQAYTRFLDLKNAEALARESQIQLALERVRARTMAMQKSDELKEVAMLLFKQVADLGITCWTTGFNVWSEDGNSYVDYVTNPLGGFMEPYTVDTTKFAVIRDITAARRKGETFYFRLETGDRQKETYSHLNEFGDKDQYGKILESGFQFPSQQVNHFVFGEKVSLLFITYDHVPEAHDIFKRFGNAFELTFTRFLDLEKAEAQARESQIQLALERVRARTMAMQKSEELNDVAILLFQQVSQLGIKTWTTGFNVWSDDNNSYVDYITSPQGNSIDAYKIDATQFPVFVEVSNVRKSGEEFWIQYLEGDILKETYRQLTKFGGEDQYDKMLADGFQFPTHQYDHFVFGSKVSLMFITYEPVPEVHDIFKRFGKVFEQTYTRFLDLKKAESQAREAHIEAALEKVRARTMGMQRSDELADAAALMFQQIKSFGLESWGCGFNIWGKDESECIGWMSTPDGSGSPQLRIPLTEHPLFIRFQESRRNGEEFWMQEMHGKELEDLYAYMGSLPVLGDVLKDFTDTGASVPTFQINHVVNFAHGNLIFITYEPCPDSHDIFKRFGKVFEQTYTRFLDLKKAEAQAREGQIEAALEKVRSSSLAMHHSDELENVVTVLFDKLLDLGLNIDGAEINIFDKAKRSYLAWVKTKFLPAPVKVNLPYDEEIAGNAIYEDQWSALETGEHVFNRTYSGKTKDDYFRYTAKHNESIIPEETRKFHLEAASWTVTWATAQNSMVGFDSWSGKKNTDEDFQVLKRFSRVFDQAYTRFLDLQKAEAQAREAHIEAALERVRSRTMAMHKSEELLDVIAVVSEQLQHVGIRFNTVSFGKNSTSFDMEFWVAGSELKSPIKISAPYTDIPMYNRLRQAHRERTPFFSDTFTAEETRVWNQHIIDHNPELFSQKSRDYLTSRPGTSRTAVLLKNVFLFLINHDFVTYSNEDIEIVIRFANVFEQTYTRFLDLQKAEAQAREAQIEAALERLRSRTMAMQRSSELAEVSQLLHQQFLSLGVQTITCAFMFPNEEKKTQSGWTVLPDGTLLPTLLDFPLLGDAILDERYRSWKERRPLHRKVLDVDENRRHHQFLREKVASHISKDIFTQLPDRLTFTNANFAQGYLMTFTTTQLAAEEENILVRFAKVFEQTYTRFLDLQKAEAQAREAQIESALEKIRSRSLAMHHSGELKDVVAIMFEKMKELNVVIGTIAIQLFDQNTMNSTFWAGNSLHDEPPKVKLPYYEKMLVEEGVMKDSWECKMKGENLINKEYTFEQKTRFFDYVFASNDLATISEADRDVIRQLVISPPHGHIVCLINEKNSSVFADSWNGEFYSDESIKVLIRAAKVFEQAYVRFLDLQKAEAQARESQIEASLERVRAKTMAMHKSQELLDVIVVVSQQLTHLGFRFDVVSFARNSEMHDYRFWFCLEKAQQAHEIRVPYLNNPMFERVKGVMARGEKFYADTLTVAENREWIEHLMAHDAWPDLTNEVKDFLLNRGYARSIVFMPQIMLLLGNYFLKPYSEEQNNILKRFAAVFEQSYTRFLDLQKAEAQAREAQIEAALERVRAKAMAMHTAQQLSEVVHELRTQMGLLGQKDLSTCVIHLNDESPEFVMTWAAIRPPDRNDEIREFNIKVPKHGLTIIEEALKAYSANQQDYVLLQEGEKLNQWIEFMNNVLPEVYDSVKGSSFDFTSQAFWSFADFQGGSLIMVTFESPDESSRVLLRRFANVFGLAYRRFADLKQAEAQAREAQIEAALERVRSTAMAMHTAEQLTEVVHELRKQMGVLGQKDLETCVIHLNDESPDFVESFAASRLPNRSDEILEAHVIIPKRGLKIIEECIEAYNANRRDYVVINDGAKLDEWMAFIRESVPAAHSLLIESINSNDQEIKERAYWSLADFQGGSMLMVTLAEPDESSRALLRRFTNVFGLAYRRFADLKHAEGQAREATIEAALEKIRSRSLGMHKSEEILDVVAILFGKLKELGLVFDGGAAIHLFSEGSRDATIWVMSPELSKPIVNTLPYDEVVADNPIIRDVWTAKDTGQHIVNKHYSFEEKREYFDYVFKHNAHVMSEEVKDFIRSANSYTANFIAEKNSLLGASSWTGQIFSENDIEVLKRVARVFEQAYIRFLDLQKAEVHAREAVCQASLDRVRAEIASMRTIEDLDRITPLIWRELNTIGIPFIRCGVFIMDEPNGVVHTFLSTPDGKAIAAFKLPFNVPGRLGNIVPHWQEKKMYLDYWDDAAMRDVADTMVNQRIFSTSQQYLDTLPKEGFHLHCLPFAQGMLYVGNLTQLKDDELTLLQSLADAFATAYARYDDFNKLESAKQQVDRTLVDLKQAQQQLVQSEKMASLGELTAGIAHEIQNPLNFVNNFSEVSNELIDEMKTELHAGNLKEAAELAESIKQNLEKITHHGKRADGIVKGMLQHSRAGSGQKEPTDLNFLCDEYLRLAYHGYRAKEKSFNAKFESSFDPTLPKVNVVGQDIGRVILNLINNAFYAVTEMKRQKVDGYEPIVSVITKNLSGKVVIRVKDNGIGISEKVLEKIFQPFFTTKPTGQGTGLGLSLSYDIIKAHGGTLEVNSKQGEGSEFIIQLPT